MKIRNPEISKEKIIKEAEKQFAEKGLLAASVNVIAENADINKRMIYHYFGSKEELYKEVLKENFNKIYSFLKEASRHKGDIVSCVKKMIKDYYVFLWENPNYVKIMAWEDVSGGKIAREVIPDTLMLGFEELEQFYQDGVEQGLFRRGFDLIQLIISVNGLCFMTFARKEMLHSIWKDDLEKKLSERLDHICDLVLQGILA